jgi:hypothetical protein
VQMDHVVASRTRHVACQTLRSPAGIFKAAVVQSQNLRSTKRANKLCQKSPRLEISDICRASEAVIAGVRLGELAVIFLKPRGSLVQECTSGRASKKGPSPKATAKVKRRSGQFTEALVSGGCENRRRDDPKNQIAFRKKRRQSAHRGCSARGGKGRSREFRRPRPQP